MCRRVAKSSRNNANGNSASAAAASGASAAGCSAPQHQAQALQVERLAVDLHRTRLAEGHAKVQAIVDQRRLQGVLGQLLEAQLDARIALIERIHQGAHQIAGEGRRHAQAQAAATEVAHLVDRSLRRFQLAQGTPRMKQVQLAGIGGTHAPAGAVEQLHAQLLFQLPHLLRQGRLRNVQRLGGAGEVAMLGDSEQVAQVAKQHGNIQL